MHFLALLLVKSSFQLTFDSKISGGTFFALHSLIFSLKWLIFYGPYKLIKDLKHGKISGGKFFTLHSLIFGLKWLISMENMIKKEN